MKQDVMDDKIIERYKTCEKQISQQEKMLCTYDKTKTFKERFNKLNKRQIQKVSKLMNKQTKFPRIRNKGVKDQLSDQRINNKRATRSDTT